MNNNVAKSGAIVTIVGGAIMSLIGFLMLLGSATTVKIVANQSNSTLFFLSFIIFALGIANIVLSACYLVNKKENFRLTAGIVAIVSLLFAWIALFFPAVVILIGGILLLCGKNQTKIAEAQAATVNTISVADITNKTKTEEVAAELEKSENN